MDLEYFAFVPLPRAAGLAIFCVRTTTTRGWDKKNFSFLTLPRGPLPRTAGLRKFYVSNTTTRGWT